MCTFPFFYFILFFHKKSKFIKNQRTHPSTRKYIRETPNQKKKRKEKKRKDKKIHEN
jgi:hypothetical protein